MSGRAAVMSRTLSASPCGPAPARRRPRRRARRGRGSRRLSSVAELSFPALPSHLIVDLRTVDAARPDAAGEYALQLTEALAGLAVHHDVTVVEPGFRGSLPAGDVLLLPAGGRPEPGYRCLAWVHDLAPLP